MAENDKYKWALPIGTFIHGGLYPYEIVDVLGHGGFGITYKVKARINLNNIKVEVYFALKEYFPTGCWRGDDNATVKYSRALDEEMKSGLQDFINEGRRLQKICNVNTHIVNVNEVFQANETAYFVMEYLSGGDLRSLVQANGEPLSEAAMLSILNPIAGALESVHENRILHLDIKPENIVMREGEEGKPDVPVLIDFGIAVHFDNRGNPTTTRPTKGATQGYSPSEQFAGVKRFDPRLDIYALSATCYYMVTGKDPQSAFDIDERDIIAELTPRVSKRTRDAIVHGMARMANQRPSSIAEFLKGFKESNALPIGTIIQGPISRYMIMAVIDEKPSYVHYKASLSIGDEQRSGTSTRDTSRKLYDIYEQLSGGKRIVAGDGNLELPWDLKALRKARYEDMRYGFQSLKSGGVSSEYFNIGGVQYLSLCEGYKVLAKERKPREPLINWQKAKRPLLITVAGVAIAAIAGLAVWGVGKMLQNTGSDDDISEVPSTEMVSESLPSEATSTQESSVAREPEPTQPVQEKQDKTDAEKQAEKKAQDDAKKKAQDDAKKKDNQDKEWADGQIKTDNKVVTKKDNRSDDEKVRDAANSRDNATLIKYARQGNETARIICENRGLKW